MSFSLIPDLTIPDIFSLTPELLRQKGITLLLLDLDNTLATYGEPTPSDTVLTWMNAYREAGIALYLISNTTNEKRAESYARAWDIPFIFRARKPSTRGIRAILADMEQKPEETALAGDQIFTDVLAANRAGIFSIVTRPLHMGLFFRLRYLIERPFRYMSKEKRV